MNDVKYTLRPFAFVVSIIYIKKHRNLSIYNVGKELLLHKNKEKTRIVGKYQGE